ncbi:MAG TPA: hypothetical protein VFM88_09855 [Vicinamibacteria bacterium]|nr:hypothetical protein [Vicinamibacteria bacterium]
MCQLRLVACLVLAGSLALPAPAEVLPDAAALEKMADRFAPVDIRVDLSALPESERNTLAKLVQAAKILDALFLRQVSAQNETWLRGLLDDPTPLGRARLRYFIINKGPWSRIDHNAPFLPGAGTKPASANFYPADATREEVEAWMESLTGAAQEAAKGFFTTIRRDPDGRLRAVPYSVEYQEDLGRASRLLFEAAAATSQSTLRRFLDARGKAFLTNDYYESDVAWMELDASVEPTIGPYEVYEDEWFNFKAAFEAFIAVRDAEFTAKLAKFGAELQYLEDRLPIDPRWRNPRLGALAPIRVVDVVIAAGDGNRGVQTAAYNLPNDERVVAAKGSKRVMLKNHQEAKFEKALLPISKVALPAEDQGFVDFDAFFTHILMHELMHGLGPQTIVVGGKPTTVRQMLKETNGPLEEAKADISGLWALQQLMDKGVLDRRQEKAMYTTFLASTFRTLRFGTSEAHGKGMALQLNHLLDHGGFRANADGTFSVDYAKVRQGVESLTREIMTIQATGNYEKARATLEQMVVVRPEVQRVIDRLADVPVDISPRYVTAEELVAQ